MYKTPKPTPPPPRTTPPPQPPKTPTPPATTTTEKPTTDSIPNLPKIEEKKEPKDGDTILSSKPDNGVTVATKVDKNSNTIKMDFNRGYVLGFAAALDPGLSKVFKGKMQGIAVLLDDYPKEFQNGFLLGYVSASDYLNTFGLLGSNPLKNK